MKIAYFDCPAGISGNMILGALVDVGLDVDYLKKALTRLPLNAYRLQLSQVKKDGIRGTYVKVKIKGKEEPKHLKDILTIIKMSKLSRKVKTLSIKIFKRLAEAEAKVHGEPSGNVHLHDVGATDAIIDIVGTLIGVEKMGIEKVYCSPLPFGKGNIKYIHGILPNPAPATAELLKGIPTYGTKMQGELVTPTGAAIISSLVKSFGEMPRLKIESIGYGAGTINLPIPNLLRVFLGEAELPTEKDAVLQIETNIDDMNPRLYTPAISKIMKAGALDAYITPIQMKKKRTGINLVVLALPENKDKVLEEIFTQTTTLGARVYLVPREKLVRKFTHLQTKYGKLKFKLGFLGSKIKTLAPELEDLKKLLPKYRMPA